MLLAGDIWSRPGPKGPSTLFWDAAVPFNVWDGSVALS